jgi:hypothetical protein
MYSVQNYPVSRYKMQWEIMSFGYPYWYFLNSLLYWKFSIEKFLVTYQAFILQSFRNFDFLFKSRSASEIKNSLLNYLSIVRSHPYTTYQLNKKENFYMCIFIYQLWSFFGGCGRKIRISRHWMGGFWLKDQI